MSKSKRKGEVLGFVQTAEIPEVEEVSEVISTEEVVLEEVSEVIPAIESTIEDVKVQDEVTEVITPNIPIEVVTEKPKKKLPEDYICGSADYPVRHSNIKKLHQIVKDYNDNNNWKWMAYDYLGIGQNGKIGKKLNEVKVALSEFPEDENIQAFLSELNLVIEKKATDIIYLRRPEPPTSEERKARQAEVLAILQTVEGLSESELNKMVRAI